MATSTQAPATQSHAAPASQLGATLLATWLVASFAVWFGGFTLYASIVVPIGTEVLGSARAQGEITQQVTHWINLFCLIALIPMWVDYFWKATRSERWVAGAALGTISLMLLILAVVHLRLDQMIGIRPDQGIYVLDRGQFYFFHRLYLWISTIQWLAGWVWLFSWVGRLRR